MAADPRVWARRILEAALGLDRGLGAFVVLLRLDGHHPEVVALESEGWNELHQLLEAVGELTPSLAAHVDDPHIVFGSVRRFVENGERAQERTAVLDRFGLGDVWCLGVGHGRQWLLAIGWPCPQRGIPEERDLWVRAGMHASTALSLFVKARAGVLSPPPRLASRVAGMNLWDELLGAGCFLASVEPMDGRCIEIALPNPERFELGQGLSERERTIATRLVSGLDYKQVAWELGVSVSTVGTVVGRILRKLRLRSKLELTALAARSSRIDPSDAFARQGYLVLPQGLSPEPPESLAVAEHQRELLALVTQGLGDAAIAERLGVSRHTIRNTLTRWIKRLGVESRAALIANLTGPGDGHCEGAAPSAE